jgi:putative peptidoglycan lipid II flippase
MSLLRAVTTMGSLTMVSRVLGFVRDVLMARILGAGAMADCFVIAFKLPNLMRRLFAEGAFSAAFVPLFSGYLEQGEDGPAARRAAALRFAEDALAVMVTALVALVALAQIFMPWVILVLGAGFADNQAKYDLAVVLSRLTFPYLLFISLVSLLGGVLNAFHRFAAVAATPVLLNLVLILSLLFFDETLQTPAHALAVGVSVAGAAQLLWLLLACRREGILLKLRLPRLTPDIKRLFVLMVPVAVGAGAYQVSLFIDTFLAGFLADGSIAFLYYADRLNQLPLGVIGVAIGTALLPMLSRTLSAGDDASARASQNRAVEIALLATLPAAAALILFPDVLVRVLFERREFTPAMTAATADALAAFAIGLPAYVLVKVFSPGYFARKDTKTPVRYAMTALGVNVVLNLILMFPLKHVGLALATSISAWLNAGLLMRGLYRRGDFAPDTRLRHRVPRILGATVLMMGACWGLLQVLAPWFGRGTASALLALALLVTGGMVAYGVSAFGLGAMTRADLALVRRRPPSSLPPA